MFRGTFVAKACVAALLLLLFSGGWALRAAQTAPVENNPDGWQIPPGAAQEENPVSVSDAVLASGKQVFASKCERCHGPGGTGNGPDADPEHKPDDLTDSSRASRNPDGVMFYKIWNGRRVPQMPAFRDELSKNDVWSVVHYVKTFRQ
jgi:mono/diheme cytochrome c family protein